MSIINLKVIIYKLWDFSFKKLEATQVVQVPEQPWL